MLNLTSTSYTTPATDTLGVIPWNTTYSGWSVDVAASDPFVYLSPNQKAKTNNTTALDPSTPQQTISPR